MKTAVIVSHVKAGLASVRSTKLRSFWSMLGVVIGVSSVVTVVAISTGIKQQISGQIHHLGKDIISVQPAQLQPSGSGNNGLGVISGLSTSGSLTNKDVTTVNQVSGVSASAPLSALSGTITGENGRYNDGFVIGTTSDLPGLINQSIAYGSFLSSDDNGTNTAVLGQHASDAMFKEDVPLGRSFTFHGQQFIVRGIFNQFSSEQLTQGVDFNDAIFIPYDVAQNLSNKTAPTYQILIRPGDSGQTDAVAKRVQSALSRVHGGEGGFSVLSGNQNVESSDSILALLTKLIAGVAAISLLVSGIGIMNVMLVSVSERKHEIGIRKAVGATNRQILTQFLTEASILSLWGGVIGIIASVLIDIALRLFTDLRPVISWQIVVLATAVSLLVGMIFGTVPAVKAARKDPIEALRSNE
ncbi:MAG TPA: ABC transporter permease [Verrucomicrobiae bacterium]|nr:ABC transporter permease [Verrucomicrobiae bacterium]